MELNDRLQKIRSYVSELSPESVSSSHFDLIIDVREPEEWRSGIIPSARTIARGFLEMEIGKFANRDSRILLYCAGGTRSLLAASDLCEMGFTGVCSLAGGMKAWKDSGRPLEASSDSWLDTERFAAQLRLPLVGTEGQKKLGLANVLIVGAGGLGSPVAYYLAAAGVGHIGIIDDDRVEKSNLQRQILHNQERIGIPKVFSAKTAIQNLNSQVKVTTYNERLTEANVDQIFPHYEIIVDGCDNFQTRYLVNDACLNHKKVNVHGSVFWFEGQASVFCHPDGPCYRCLFPVAPDGDLAPNCAEAGVLGPLPGLIGLVEATEVIKLILSIGSPLVGRLLKYDALEMDFTSLKVRRDKTCSTCLASENKQWIKYQSLAEVCSQDL